MGKLTPTERKALYKMFANYRAYKEAIANRSTHAARGFASAIHPHLIHATRVHPGGPGEVSGVCVTPGFSEATYRRFVWRIDWHVRRLPPYQKCIIRKRFLGRGKLPTDKEVHGELRKEGWYVSKRYFDAQKEEGIEELFRSLKSSDGVENDEKSLRKNVRKNGSISTKSHAKI